MSEEKIETNDVFEDHTFEHQPQPKVHLPKGNDIKTLTTLNEAPLKSHDCAVEPSTLQEAQVKREVSALEATSTLTGAPPAISEDCLQPQLIKGLSGKELSWKDGIDIVTTQSIEAPPLALEKLPLAGNFDVDKIHSVEELSSITKELSTANEPQETISLNGLTSCENTALSINECKIQPTSPDHDRRSIADGSSRAGARSPAKATNGENADVEITPKLPSMNAVSIGCNGLQASITKNEDTVEAHPINPQFNQEVFSLAVDCERTLIPKSPSMEVPSTAKIKTEEAEFELDSSPIESSSSDLSTDSSSSDDSDQDDYEMLDPAEQARRLMQEDGGSDDDGGGKSGNAATSGPLRTLNEKPEEVIPKPSITVTEDMKISELGNVENLVENLVVIKAKTSGENQVLEFGSLLCLEDRSVIGVVAETLGRVQQPYYSVRFTNEAAISEVGISQGTKIFYVDRHSSSVFTQSLKAYKGSDASNLHDEEVGDAEMEFSDDEAEAEHKRKLKMTKQSRREGRHVVNDGFIHNVQQNRNQPYNRPREHPLEGDGEAALRNENNDQDDGLYTPLARPSNLHEIMGQREAPIEACNTQRSTETGNRGERDRVNRGRGREDRGRGGRGSHRTRGGFSDRNRNGNDHGHHHNQRNGTGQRGRNDRFNGVSNSHIKNELPQRPDTTTFHTSPPPISNNALGSYPPAQTSSLVPNPSPPYQSYPQPFVQQSPSTRHQVPYNQISPSHQYYVQNYPPQPPPQYPYPNNNYNHPPTPYAPYQQPLFTPPKTPSNIPPGAYINPAFFASQQPSLPIPQQQWLPESNPQPHQQQHPYHSPHPHPVSHKAQAHSSPESDAAFRAAQERLDVLRTLTRGPP